MKTLVRQLQTEDWIIVLAGFLILTLATLFPRYMPTLPSTILSMKDVVMIIYMYAFMLTLTVVTSVVLKRPLRGLVMAFTIIFALVLAAQLIAGIPEIRRYGFESVFFAVLLGLLVSNVGRLPQWMLTGIQSEFYIKIGIVCLGSTILFGEVLKSGFYGLAQALVVVLTVWYVALRIARRLGVDDEMATMLSSAVSICGVSAAIATCGVIKGDSRKLSYVISLVLVYAVPMMYLMPWLATVLDLSEECAGAWMGGTIDTTGAVAASGTLLGEKAAQTAIIVKSSQNVLLGIAAFAISLFWTYRGNQSEEKPTLRLIWSRFPKFVLGFVLASLFFSLFFDMDSAKSVGKVTKGFSNTLFNMAFVCIGLETRFGQIFGHENRRPLVAFLSAQTFNIIFTLAVSYLLFSVLQ